ISLAGCSFTPSAYGQDLCNSGLIFGIDVCGGPSTPLGIPVAFSLLLLCVRSPTCLPYSTFPVRLLISGLGLARQKAEFALHPNRQRKDEAGQPIPVGLSCTHTWRAKE